MYNIQVVFWELCSWHKIFFYVLTTTIGLGISFVAPLASSFIPNWTPHLKLTKEQPMMSGIIKSKFDRSTSSKISHVCPSTLEFYKEWQKSFAFILDENGGLRDENIVATFYLWCAKRNGGTPVSWFCKKHYGDQMFFLLR